MFDLDNIISEPGSETGGRSFRGAGSDITSVVSSRYNKNSKSAKASAKSSSVSEESGIKEPTDVYEQNKILTRYLEIPKQSWSSIPPDTYVRYIDDTSALKAGGRIKNIIPDGNFLYITINRKSRYSRTNGDIALDSRKIQRLFKFIDDKVTGGSTEQSNQTSSAASPAMSMSQLNEKILFDEKNIISDRITEVEARITKIETSIQQIIRIIKQMAGK